MAQGVGYLVGGESKRERRTNRGSVKKERTGKGNRRGGERLAFWFGEGRKV